MSSREDRLPGRGLARVARWVAPASVNERVLVPLLADYQHENCRAVGLLARARVQASWLLAFWWSLAVEVSRAGRGHLRRNAWGTTEDERTTTRVFLRYLALSVTWLVLLLILRYPYRALVVGWPASAPANPGFLVLVLPPVLGAALPLACLLGILVAAHQSPGRQLRLRSLAGVAALAGLATFANLNWVTTKATLAWKDAYRAHISRLYPEAHFVDRGRNVQELSVHQAAARAADLRAKSRSLEATHFEVEIHKKPALGAWCLALTLLGAAVSRRVPHAVLRWIVAFAVCGICYALLRFGEQAAEAGQVPAALGMWAPVLTVTALAVVALRSRRSTSESGLRLTSARRSL